MRASCPSHLEMAAATGHGGEAAVRLRLSFDFPPPGSPGCGRCWLLLEPSQVRLVTDLVSVIRERFGFSRRARLSLFLDGALLPPTESARLVRDNDALRVRLEEGTIEDSSKKTANGFTHLSKKERKQQRQKLEAEESSSENEEYRKRKKSKWTTEQLSSQEENATHVVKKLKKREKVVTENNCTVDNTIDDNSSHSKKLKKREQEKAEKDKKKQKARIPDTKTNKSFPSGLSQKCPAKNTKSQSNTKIGKTSNESSSSSSDSDHNTNGSKQKLPHKAKAAAQDTHESQMKSQAKSAAGNLSTEPKSRSSCNIPNNSKSASPSSSSDSDSSSGRKKAQQSSNLKKKLPHNYQGTGTSCISKSKPKTSSSESDSSDSDSGTVKKPKTNVTQSVVGNADKLPNDTSGPTRNHSNPGRGRGRGESAFWRGPRLHGCRGMVRGRGRGRGEAMTFFYNYNGERQKQQQLNEVATNASVIIQNSPETPKKDYSILPLLAAPPQVGEKIAFKLVELTDNYTPEVSDYKEGKIVNWNPTNKQIELEILSFSSVAKEPGKFDLVYQSPDGAETIEYAIPQERKIKETWDALIEPRLIVDPPKIESVNENGNL